MMASDVLRADRCISWRAASSAELNASVRLEQMQRPCNVKFQHECMGTCNLGSSFQGSTSSLTLKCDSDIGGAALRRILDQHVKPPSCRLTVAGDSVQLQLWTAVVSAALQLGYRLLDCQFNAGRDHWLGIEHGFCGATYGHAPKNASGGQRVGSVLLPDTHSQGAAAIYSSWARFGGVTNASCAEVTVHYWEIGHRTNEIGRWARHISKPKASSLLNASSVLLLSVGTHGNSVQELHELWRVHVDPFLMHLKRTGPDTKLTGAAVSVLWLGVPAQHFYTRSGSGSYHEREPHQPCAAVNATAAEWRDQLFAKWLEPRRPVRRWNEASTFGIYVDRPDLHGKMKNGEWDCTHYCFSPFLYQPMWSLIEKGLQKLDSARNGTSQPAHDSVHVSTV